MIDYTTYVIKTIIGYPDNNYSGTIIGNIKTILSQLGTDNTANSITKRLQIIESDYIKKNTTDALNRSITNIQSVIGTSDNPDTGTIRKRLNDIESTIGNSDNPDNGTIRKRLNDIETAGYVTSDDLDNTDTGYVKLSSLNGKIDAYVKSESTNELNKTYVKLTDLTSTLKAYLKTADLEKRLWECNTMLHVIDDIKSLSASNYELENVIKKALVTYAKPSIENLFNPKTAVYGGLSEDGTVITPINHT